LRPRLVVKQKDNLTLCCFIIKENISCCSCFRL